MNSELSDLEKYYEHMFEVVLYLQGKNDGKNISFSDFEH